MKKRTEIQQDLKRGFSSAPTGIKIWVKRLAVGLVVYLAVRFACAFIGGVVTGLGGVLPTLAVVVFLVRAAWRILSALLSIFVFCLLLILFCMIL